MSGGSWNYAYHEIQEIAETLQQSNDPLRRAFGAHMELCSEAIHDIEWVDSGDYSEGREIESIEKVLGGKAKVLALSEVLKEAKRIKEELEKYGA